MQTYPDEALQYAIESIESGEDKEVAVAAALQRCLQEGLIIMADRFMMLQLTNAVNQAICPYQDVPEDDPIIYGDGLPDYVLKAVVETLFPHP